MSTLNQQCQYCFQTTSAETIDDDKDYYEYIANGDCGCEREKREQSFDEDDDD